MLDLVFSHYQANRLAVKNISEMTCFVLCRTQHTRGLQRGRVYEDSADGYRAYGGSVVSGTELYRATAGAHCEVMLREDSISENAVSLRHSAA